MFKIGDKVSVIHEKLIGTIIKINGREITIEEEDNELPFTFLKNQIVPYKSESDYKLTDEKIEQVINEQQDRKRLTLNNKQGTTATHNRQESFEIDLHIEELIDDHKFLPNSEIMMIQMRYCRIFIDKALRLKVKKALIIHGKGEGVLRTEIHKYLERIENQRHLKLDFKEINNGGATVVYL